MSNALARMMNVSSVRLALAIEQMRSQMESVDLLRAEPIAIIGMGCRFPGSRNPAAYWQLLRDGVDAISEIPPDRWDVDDFYDPDRATPGKMNTRWGGFLDRIDQFDADFFGISPREAARMDPQQRLLLEVAYEALEDAGQVQEQLNGSQTGVFIASTLFDYAQNLFAQATEVDAHSITGNMHCILANRLSFLLNLRGPSMAVDTACSSSLVAVHLACQSLRNRECEMAVAGGVNVISSPEIYISLAKWGMVTASDGRCKTFDAGADGFIRAEGCGVIILKRLSKALSDGDRIVGVIRGSAVNQDGRSTNMTAPNGLAQQDVIRQALQNAAVTPDQVSYIEAHGTGTALGDPIEVEALAEVYGAREANGRCLLGSVKTNVGHLEAAAGIAGLMKVVLSLQHEAIPAHLHFKTLNPHISPDNFPFVIPTEMHPWPAGQKFRLAGVSSFGIGGTNAHVLIEEAPRLPAAPAPEATGEQAYLLPLSAHSPEALRALAQAYHQFFEDSGAALNLKGICYSAGAHRNHYDYRLALVGHSAQEFGQQLLAFLQEEPPAGSRFDHKKGNKLANPVFVFSGQGPQWWAMGRELLAQEPVFKEVIEKCDQLLHPYTGWSLLAELTAAESESRLDQTEVAQPALFALQIALAALWHSWGILPGAVVGHSVGEIAAAYVAGVLSLEEAVRIVFHRSRLMQQATGLGKMAAVEISPVEAERLIAPYGDRLALAAINSPTSVVLSGEAAALETVLQGLQAQGIFNRMLPVNYAFHSHQMAPFQEALTRTLQDVVRQRGALPIFSTVTGLAAVPQDFGADYWGRNIREPVRFAPAMGKLLEAGFETFLEIGPHPVLSRAIEQCLSHQNGAGAVLASLRRNKPERAALLTTLGTLYSQGSAVNWKGVYPASGRPIPLPSYPWQRKRYWFTPSQPQTGTRSSQKQGGRSLLGERLRSPALKEIVFESRLGFETALFLEDHHILGLPLFPATAYLEMAVAAAAELWQVECAVVEDLLIQEALVVPESGLRTVQLLLTPTGEYSADFQIFSLGEGTEHWTLHATGKVRSGEDLPALTPPALAEIQAKCLQDVETKAHYHRLYQQGFEFGPGFQGLERLWRDPQQQTALGQVRLPETLSSETSLYRLHPALLDGCLQPILATLSDHEQDYVYLPINLEALRLYHRPASPLWSYGQARPGLAESQDMLVGDFYLYDEAGQVVAEVVGLHLKRTNLETLRRALNKHAGRALLDDSLYKITWEARSRQAKVEQPNQPGHWLICIDREGVGTTLAELLRERGAACTLISPGSSYHLIAENWWQVDPGCPADFESVLEAAGQTFGNSGNAYWQGVIHLWSLDTGLPGSESDPASEAGFNCSTILHLVQALFKRQESLSQGLWLVTRGAQPVNGAGALALRQAPVWGLGRTLALEHPSLACSCIDLDPAPGSSNSQTLFEELEAWDGEAQIAFRNGARYVARLKRSQELVAEGMSKGEPVRLEISRRGTLENLVLRPAAYPQPAPGEVAIRVRATGLNFRDVLNALDMYPGDPGPLGHECAGEVVAVGEGVTQFRVGDKVMALASGSFSTFVTTPAAFVVLKPASLTFEEAATILIPFLTAYYALHHLAKMSAGDKVLIHAAAGGVGLAAVQLAQRAGAEVFGTAGSPEKRAFLQSLGVTQVMGSRSLDFAAEIMALTEGTGVDIVLNSLNGDFIPKSLETLQPQGHFLEIGKLGIWEKAQVAQVKPQAAYSVIYLGETMEEEPALIQSMLLELVAALEEGSLKPLPLRVFPLQDVAGAFRTMAQAKHIGKVVVTQAPASTEGAASTPIHAQATYLITGGLGGLGLLAAKGLVAQGARHLALVGRRPASDKARQALSELEQAGAQVWAAQADISKEAEVRRILTTIEQSMPPLRGIIHAAGVVADSIVLQQDRERLAQVMAPKVTGTWLLHSLTQHLALDFFVAYSSISSILGSGGQSNYAAANAFLDALAYQRQAQGLPALSLNWGPWAEVGMAQLLSERDQRRWLDQGMEMITPESGLEILQQLLSQKYQPQTVVLSINWSAYLQRFPAGNPPSLFAGIAQELQTRGKGQPGAAQEQEFLQRLAETPAGKQRGLLLAYLREQANRVLGLNLAHPIDPKQPLNELGLDSLMAVELRNILSSSLQAALPATLLFDYPTLETLADYLAKKVLSLEAGDKIESEARTDTRRAEALAELEGLSDEEAEALLLAELSNPKGN